MLPLYSSLTHNTMKNSLILTLATVLLAGCQLFAQPSDTTIQPLEEPEETTQDTQDQEVEFAPVDYDTNIRIQEEHQSLVQEDELIISNKHS